MSSETFSGEIPYSEAAHWFIRVNGGPLTEPEWARFRNWLNFSRWNRLAFDRVSIVWRGAPDAAAFQRRPGQVQRARFSWHHSDAWRDAVLPLAMTWLLNSDACSGTGASAYRPVQAAAAPVGLL